MGVERIYSGSGGKSVTASDTVDFGGTSRGLNVSTTGSYKVTMVDGTTPTLYLLSGVIHPIECTRVWSTGAASTSGIVAIM